MPRPLVVNFHEHPSPAVPQRYLALGIDVAVLLPVGPDAAALARGMAQAEPERYIAFHWVDVSRDADAEARRLRRGVTRWGLKGVKFQPMDQHLYPNDRRLYPIFEVCEELNLVVTFHMGTVYLGPYMHEMGVPMLAKYCDPIYLDEVAFDFPDLKLCIAHIGGEHLYTALVLCEKHRQVYVDTAFLGHFAPRFFPPTTPTAIIEHAVRIAGPDKVLYGSEGVPPEAVLKSALNSEEQAKVLGLNACRLLDIAPTNMSAAASAE